MFFHDREKIPPLGDVVMKGLLEYLLEKYRLQIGIFLIAAVVVGGGVLALTTERSRAPEIEKIAGAEPSISGLQEGTTSAATITPLPKIKVDIAGAVINPGVYELSEDGRVEDALAAAGGLSGEADRTWAAKNLNLATKLRDGDKLYIPKVGEGAPLPVSQVSGTTTTSESSNCSSVNINTASAGTLDECLSGIGPAYAQGIIDYRESHNGFKTIEEIQEVRGIGPKTFEKIKDQIVID